MIESMIIAVLAVVGLCMGSFVNALVWRVHEQAEEHDKKRPNKKYLNRLSIRRGRSMCTHCHHELAARDLIPVVSWLQLHGKCRYCGKPIDDSPIVEVALAVLFVASYIWWPEAITGFQVPIFVLWLVLLVGLAALTVYDLRWMLLPNRLIYPLAVVAVVQAIIAVAGSAAPLNALWNAVAGVAVGGGVFYLLYQLSKGKWIGGGDVRLGWLLGLIAATPGRSLLLIFVASLAGSLVSVPLLSSGRLKRTSTVPFGPFLILGIVVVVLFGMSIGSWYQHTFMAVG